MATSYKFRMPALSRLVVVYLPRYPEPSSGPDQSSEIFLLGILPGLARTVLLAYIRSTVVT